MPKILAFGASTSNESINKQFAKFAGSSLPNVTVELVDLNDYELPMYSVDEEGANGIPEAAKAFVRKVEDVDGIIISLAEHNGSYTAAFKNLLDWCTRSKQKVWSEKPMILLSTSPGARGGASVLDAAAKTFPHLGGNVVASFSLPSFTESFSLESGIQDEALKKAFARKLAEFCAVL
ncbi:MAG: NADPH-dependent FMN reductase [Opitutaceae bacterium]